MLALILTVPYYYYYDDKVSLYNFDFITAAQFTDAIFYHLIAMNAYCFGILLFYQFSGSKTKQLLNKPFGKSLFLKPDINFNLFPAIYTLIGIILLFCGISYGTDIFYREEYLVEGIRMLTTLFKLLSFIVILMLAISYRKNKWLSSFLFSLVVLIAIGTGSRLAFVYVIVFALLLYQTSKNTTRDKLIFGRNILFSFFFLVFIMTLRRLPNHGIIPYVASVFNNSSELGDSAVFNVYYTFIFGVFVSAKTLMENTADWSNIIVSVNPVTGSMAGWYDVAPKMRLNKFAPMSAHGEVFTMGKIFTIVFFTITAMIFSYFETYMRSFFKKGKRVLGFIVALLSILFVALSFEYNLRSTVRYIYYIGFVVLLGHYLGNFKFKLGKVIVHKLSNKSMDG